MGLMLLNADLMGFFFSLLKSGSSVDSKMPSAVVHEALQGIDVQHGHHCRAVWILGNVYNLLMGIRQKKNKSLVGMRIK